MFSPSLEIAFLEVARVIAGFALTWLVQSTLIILTGLTLAWVLSRWGAAAQSIVYRATLAAIVLCPFFSWFLAASGVTGYSLTLPQTWNRPVPNGITVLAPPIAASSLIQSTFPRPDQRGSASDREIGTGRPAASTGNLANQSDSQHDPARPANSVSAGVSTNAPSHDLQGFTREVQPARPISITAWGYAAGAFSLLWFAYSGVCCVRLAHSWRRLARIRQTAIPADEATSHACKDLSGRMGIAAPAVLLTPFVPGPCLTGWRKPAILLPEENDPPSIGNVLTHELAHLVRGDVPWHHLRMSMTSLFFFQPLLGYLSRRIEMTAEEVCDDWVVEFGHDRAEYAHRLVTTAESAGVSMATVGVAMIAHRSILARRVTRILDRSRLLSTGTSRTLMTVILAIIGISALAIGLVQAAPRSSLPSQSKNDEVSIPSTERKTLPSKENHQGKLIVRGRVRTPEGKPAAGARISVRRQYRTSAVQWAPVGTAVSDQDGKFELKYRECDEDSFGSTAIEIAAEADGYGTQWADLQEIGRMQELVLNLVPEYPIKGRIIDLQGKPVEGVNVTLLSLACPKFNENLDRWIAAVKSGAMRDDTFYMLGMSLPGIQENGEAAIRTDEDGRFTLRGVGAERVAEIELRHDTIAYQRLTVATRAMAPLSRNLSPPTGLDKPPIKDTVYGKDFTFPAAPTRAIEGTVRDAKTGNPIAGVEIASDHLAGALFHPQNRLRTKTDAQGRYRLAGLPLGNGPHKADFNVLKFFPTGDIPYLMRTVTIPSGRGPGPQSLDLALGQGIWISGRVTEKGTGKPVQACIQYFPFRDNPNTLNRPEFHRNGDMDGDPYRIIADQEGKYRIAGLPGRAIVTAYAPGKIFNWGEGASEISGMKDGMFRTYASPSPANIKSSHALKEINLPQGATKGTCDIALDAGMTARLTILDELGQPLAGCKIAAREGESSKTGELEVKNQWPDSHGECFIFHGERNLGKIVKIAWKDNAPVPMTVKLEKCAKVKGRLTDQDGAPFKSLQIWTHSSGGGIFTLQDGGMVFSKPDGTFELPHIPTGCSHFAFLAVGEGFKAATIAKNVAIQAGHTIDLGTLKIELKR